MPLDWSPLWLSLRYAAFATLLAAVPALPIAWLLARRRFPGCELVAAAANLFFYVPPAVVVYYLLAGAGVAGLRFQWDAAVAVSAVYTLPVLLYMMRGGMEAVDGQMANAARTLGAGEWRTFSRITLPLAWKALLDGVVVGFLRAFADFTLTMIAARRAGIGLLLPFAAFAAVDLARRLRRRQVAV